MNFNARFTYTHSLVANLGRIEAARSVVEMLPLPPDQVLLLRQSARQRATRNSTAIEGNTLDSIAVGRAIGHPERSKSDMEQEVRNYWRALDWIEEQIEAGRPLTEDFIRELHSIIIVRGYGRRGSKSEYRTTECPVVDTATKAIDYGPPKPKDVPLLMKDLISWLNNKQSALLPGPVRAGLLAHRFVSIHPFADGNGRMARALATSELWRCHYDMRGFLSLEEYYTTNLGAYYASLQMGLPVDYYAGRNDPDHTIWLEYFVSTMAEAAETIRKRAEAIHPKDARSAPWEQLHRVQQQLLSMLLTRCMTSASKSSAFTPADIRQWYGVSSKTALEWLGRWRDEGFIMPERSDTKRIRGYILVVKWQNLLNAALDKAQNKTT